VFSAPKEGIILRGGSDDRWSVETEQRLQRIGRGVSFSALWVSLHGKENPILDEEDGVLEKIVIA